jgi:predicted AlkP superfamily pyrophosphatase or phosphodiesterase
MKITKRFSRVARSTVTPSILFSLIFSASLVVSGAELRPEVPRQAHKSRIERRSAQTDRRATTAASPRSFRRPRLVMLIAVDQFRYDFLERFDELFGANGLKRLQRDGASWTNANYDHIPTETAPGHATMLTGAWPSETGIVGNDWFDRASKKLVSNVVDSNQKLLGGGSQETASSPKNLLVSTLGDELKLISAGRSKVIGISVKDRGAILPVGRAANAAYWYSPVTGEFVSSTYYFSQLPAWVASFNAARPANKYFGAIWERLLPEKEYRQRAGDDAPPWEIDATRLKKSFPHVFNGGETTPGAAFFSDLRYAPYTNDLVIAFVEQAIINEGLGADADTDVLSVSLSANDYVGHQWGPYSHEAMDITLRTDQQIATLLDIVEKRVGLRNAIVAFTGDHGVAPTPEHAIAVKLNGGRLKPSDVVNVIRAAIKSHFGLDGRDASDYVAMFDNNNIYFDNQALARDRVSHEEIERVAGEAALTVPGIARYFTRTQLATRGISPSDAIARRVLHGFYPPRSGDVVVVQEPYKYLVEYQIVATHGAPYSYDTHVPLIIMGAGLTPGRYLNSATPADIAPTLAALLRIEPPSNAVGRVLNEAIK